MNLRDRIENKFFPEAYGRRQVQGMLTELTNRPRLGDGSLHQTLDDLNKTTDAFEIDNLNRAYQQGRKQILGGGEKSAVREAIERRQAGFGLQIATQAFADGQLDDEEKLAIGDIASQRYTVIGACADLPRLGYKEAAQLESFSKAPSNTIRTWMLEQAKTKEVGMEAVRDLAEMLFADGGISPDKKAFLVNTGNIFGVPVQSEAQMFLRGLGTTQLAPGNDQTGPSLLDEARSKDYFIHDNFLTDCGMARSTRHVDSLVEAVTFTLAHQPAADK
ncbi:hypothetical protein ABS71_14720 [bacterium SCN 62-11]|nr:hypothetical protein [Candidatus Eremiobacteraeota bacterium]ODT63132.1 MAG: hypothetical protein ABS71_14720 [bacterium SCN 62-11]